MDVPRARYEYVVVGSGAGGGTVAARLAEAGHTVLLLEAGGDACRPAGGQPGDDRLPADYQVPVFNAFASENAAMRWDFFVRHYDSAAVQARDPNYREMHDGQRVDGVLYPRAGTLGGCTAHNALITMYPHNADWDAIAELTGDASWDASHMRQYFERLECCQYLTPIQRWLARLGWNVTRHGSKGWLSTEEADIAVLLRDRDLVQVVIESLVAAFEAIGEKRRRLKWLMKGKLDPNDWRLVCANAIGLVRVPLATRNHTRNGTREFVLDVAKRHPDRLTIELHALATRVLFDGERRAIGVEYLKGERLYRAHAAARPEAGERREAHASREVVLSGGAFNTPQLLMLSGIGPEPVLRGHGIDTLVDLPGVGQNLQDRYEVGVVNRMTFRSWTLLDRSTFSTSDPQYQQWAATRGGVYATNGAPVAILTRSAPTRPLPDLCLLALLGNFRGYYPGYSTLLPKGLNYLTWAILKAHTNNTAGSVTLRSADPRDVPDIRFRYFEEGNDTAGEDLQSVVAGIKLARKLTAPVADLIAEEELPGRDVQSDADLAEFVRRHAWGHHPSCTCAIGPRERRGVVNGDFEVHGVTGLRVVDASVFPRIPGFFLVTPVYMVGEKASDVIAAAARTRPPRA